MGFVFQVNVLSLAGYYGKRAEKAAKFILEKDLAILIGTDLHHQKHLDTLCNPQNRLIFQQLMGNNVYNDLDLLYKISKL